MGGGSWSRMRRQGAGDARPQPLGERLDRVAQRGRHLAVGVELGPTARALGQVGLDHLVLVAVQGVEGEHGQELSGLLMAHHASTPWTPASTRAARMRRMPLRMRLFMVPSGVSSRAATST